MKMQSVADLLYTGLTYVHDFEQKISQEALKMAEASQNTELKEAFSKSATKGKQYAERVQQAFANIGQQPEQNENHIAKAMIAEVENMIANTDRGAVRDAALIVAANQQQMYRVAAYGSLRDYAGLIGKENAVEELENNLEDSKGGDEKLTRIGQETVNREAAQGAVAA